MEFFRNYVTSRNIFKLCYYKDLPFKQALLSSLFKLIIAEFPLRPWPNISAGTEEQLMTKSVKPCALLIIFLLY